MVEKGRAIIFVIIVCDHGLEKFHARVAKEPEDFCVSIKIFHSLGAGAGTEGWVEHQDDSSNIGLAEILQPEAILEENSDTKEPFFFVPVVAAFEEISLLLEHVLEGLAEGAKNALVTLIQFNSTALC
jgi:hypothetical protein